MRFQQKSLALFGLAAALSLAGAAFATREGDDRDRAEAALATLERVPEHARLGHELVSEARRALRRADEARAAGDTRHAPDLDALGREQAETATDLVRAVEAEKKLVLVQKQISDVETRTSRAKALLEEAVARRGRAQVRLDELDQKAAAAPAPEPPKKGAAPKVPAAPALKPTAPKPAAPKAPVPSQGSAPAPGGKP